MLVAPGMSESHYARAAFPCEVAALPTPKAATALRPIRGGGQITGESELLPVPTSFSVARAVFRRKKVASRGL